MLGKHDIKDSIGYVTLGLFANALIDELLEAGSHPESPPENKPMIELAVDSIDAFENADSVSRPGFEELVFQDYQEARALRKMFRSRGATFDSASSLRDSLKKIVEANVSKETRKDNIHMAIIFFCKLGREAIIDAECSEEQIPPGVIRFAVKRNSK
ncbi:MAG: hypothetical protein JXA81_12615 [Sedimentisphaerales bacterium]|nr:hypothetical protein [Sedimentisphaerales bacterium]